MNVTTNLQTVISRIVFSALISAALASCGGTPIENPADLKPVDTATSGGGQAGNGQIKPFDAAIRKVVKGQLVYGQPGAYILHVLNLGPNAIISGPITVFDVLPTGLSLNVAQAIASNLPNWNCNTSSSTQLVCNYVGSLPILVGQNVPVIVPVNVAKNAPKLLKNCASLKVPGDIALGNNTSCIESPVYAKPVSVDVQTALDDVVSQLETVLESSGSAQIATEKASSGLKDTIKTQVRLTGLTFEPIDGEGLFEVNNAATLEKFTVSVSCDVSYPPLKAACTITVQF